jgi:hypothetical protein
MANVVVLGGVIECSHGGQVRLASGDSWLDVDGNDIIVQGQEVGLSFAPGSPGVISPCTFTTPAGNVSPCTATQAATTGISTELTVGGLGVLLDTAGGVATNTPPVTWSVQSAGQSKLESDGS